MKGYYYMNIDNLIYDLAMIYAKERFHDTLKGLSEEQKIDYDNLTKLLYCYFEDAYIAFHLMPAHWFDFSDITTSN